MKRCGPAVRDAILGHVEPVVFDPRDELPVPDIIGSGGEDFSAFAESRWPGLVKRAFGLTGDRRAAEDIAQITLARAYVAWWRVSRTADPDAYLHRLLVRASSRRPRADRVAERATLAPDSVPLATILRRGQRIRLRRAGIAAGGLSLAALMAATILLIPHGVIPLNVSVGRAGLGSAPRGLSRLRFPAPAPLPPAECSPAVPLTDMPGGSPCRTSPTLATAASPRSRSTRPTPTPSPPTRGMLPTSPWARPTLASVSRSFKWPRAFSGFQIGKAAC